MFVNAPSSSTAGAAFQVSASVSLRNNGSEPTVLVDTGFTPAAPPDCFATPGAIVVQDRWLPANASVSISRSWSITCTQAGAHTFTMNLSVAIDPTQFAVDPNLANNTGSGTDSTMVN